MRGPDQSWRQPRPGNEQSGSMKRSIRFHYETEVPFAMTHVVTSSNVPILNEPWLLPESRDISATAVWLVIVIFLAVIVLVGAGCTPATAVTAVAGGSLIAGHLRQELV